jgi:hypothetical protein
VFGADERVDLRVWRWWPVGAGEQRAGGAEETEAGTEAAKPQRGEGRKGSS